MKRCYSCFGEYGDAFDVCPHCGQIEITKPNEPIQLYPGTILANRYIIGKAEGAGGFGIVYKAWDSKLETIVAIKEFFVSRLFTRAEGLKNLIITKKSQAEYEYRKARFLAEARTMAKFGSHKNITNVFEFFEENNTAYIVMEYLPGVSLNEYIKENGGKIDADFAIVIANEVGNALKALHEKNIIHRDVAPDNIRICPGKEIRIKLMDLGAAKLCDETDNVVDIVLKPGYSPVEQYDNSGNFGAWTDIYALGATLYMMLTGVKPEESTNRKIDDAVVSPNQINPLISENLSNTIMKAMALDIHMRFKNTTEFLNAINGQKKVISLANEKKRRKAKRFTGIIAACLALSIALGSVFISYKNKKSEQYLEAAEITIWFSVTDGSTEKDAIYSIVDDFISTFENIIIDVQEIPESEYEAKLIEAANQGELPTLFESTGIGDEVLDKASDVDNVLYSEQASNCYFLEQYDNYYSERKKIPLAIEVPIACVITNGTTSLKYERNYFEHLSDFGTNSNISFDDNCAEMIKANFGTCDFSPKNEFLNNTANTSPVLLSSTMEINEVRTTLINYEKIFVYYDSNEINCNFTYEWSIGEASENEIKAAERLLSWMLGNVYQSTLMISKCSDGQIPINPIAFESKIQAKNLAPIGEIYEKFVFEGEK